MTALAWALTAPELSEEQRARAASPVGLALAAEIDALVAEHERRVMLVAAIEAQTGAGLAHQAVREAACAWIRSGERWWLDGEGLGRGYRDETRAFIRAALARATGGAS